MRKTPNKAFNLTLHPQKENKQRHTSREANNTADLQDTTKQPRCGTWRCTFDQHMRCLIAKAYSAQRKHLGPLPGQHEPQAESNHEY